ncbi:hypothetical protein [Gimesia maris]|uniref:hypothetical protein n=1 Tax=Gimesia maris TaxID=122 RepID=UPI003A8E328A
MSVSNDVGKSFTSPQVLKTFDSTMRYQHAANLAIGKAEDGAIVLMADKFEVAGLIQRPGAAKSCAAFDFFHSVTLR